HLQRAYGSFLDLDARRLAAWSAYERSQFELRMGRYDESAVYREKAMSLHTAGEDLTLDGALERLGADLYASFAEGWSKSSEIARSLDEIRRLFQGADTTHSATEELVRLAVMQTNSDRGCVAETTDSGFSILAVHGWDQEYAAGHLQKIDGVLESVAKDNNPLWSTIQGSPHLPADREGENENFVVLPLTLNDQRSGFLYVEKVRGARGGSYHTGDMHLLTVLASLTAISVIGQKNTQLEKENEALRRQIEASTRFVTANPELLESIRLAKKVAQSPVSILISGETGTGKGLLSHVIHESSNRSDKPFVQINCAALPEQLLESELFGHMKGAFTGATYNKVGLFKEADGGTLFLDEVDKASLSVQSKLLHVLDTKEVRPVGSVQSFVVDTRVICATNSELRQQIEDGQFLRDLYYRLNDFTVPVHALRERPEDLPLLIDHFLTKFCDQYDRDMVKLSPQVREALLNHKWPGNVRELEKTLRRLVVLSDAGTLVGAELLPAEMQVDTTPVHGNGAPTTLRAELARTERRVLLDALQERDWNRSKVSRDLKISYPSLLKKIKEYNLEPAARS
ncbi:MAG: sigma 54-interacting transcriptional regulator, partial [Candidatus Eisenbacteria bacterium]|nr:sigma 54-interacting transcriptional regulator [Candidatus Eisenbacteria bacterium]